MISVDEVLLERVIFNLVENAAKYSPEDSPIEIHVNRQNEFICVGVRDHGGGFMQGEEDCVFDKFYQGYHKKPHNGIGLGLTICKGIVEAHGGKICAANHVTGGR